MTCHEEFDIKKFDDYKEGNCLEVKKAKGGLPSSLWETYSSFANCNGGVIILGVEEKKDGSWYTTGLKKEDIRKLTKSFWDTLNDPKKVSANLLTDKDLETYELGSDAILVIKVPMARRQDKPVFINGDFVKQTFRRNSEGDYHCTWAQIKGMLRDQTENTMDMEVLENFPMDYLCHESIKDYKNRHKSLKFGHPFETLSNEEFLRSIGAASISDKDGKYHPTVAGLLMFGYEYNIVLHYPDYFLDYREVLDPTIRWTDRLISTSGEWSGNLFDFYFRVYNKIIKEIKVPFKMIKGTRIDDTPMHKAVREALLNCLVNADFYVPRGLVIKLENHTLTLENPGYIRVGRKQIMLGGVSDPRNRGLMKMFNMIDIGERSGSGVPNIYNVWKEAGYKMPEIIEEFDPDRTKLILSFEKCDEKQAIITNDKKRAKNSKGIKKTSITSIHKKRILAYMKKVGETTIHSISKEIGLSCARTRSIVAEIPEIESFGNNRNRSYRLKAILSLENKR